MKHCEYACAATSKFLGVFDAAKRKVVGYVTVRLLDAAEK